MHVKHSVWRHSFPILVVIALSLTLIGATNSAPFPDVIPLPNGFRPEGIASGLGSTFFAGSIPTGAVYRGDLATGKGEVLIPPQAGRMAIGMKFDDRTGLLFVAGGPTGHAFVYDGGTGANIADIMLTGLPSFINDVAITGNAVYFTNSFQPILYKISLERNGELPAQPVGEAIPLGGDYQFTPGGFNANGIAVAPNGKTLIIVNSIDGTLYSVDPETGVASHIDLGTGGVPNGDGILLQGTTLFVVQNALNRIAVIELEPGFGSGEIVDLITDAPFRVPTTIAKFGNALYAVNARFDTPPTPDTAYEVVRVSLLP